MNRTTRFIAVHYSLPNMVAAAYQIALDSKAAGITPVVVDLRRQSRHHRWNPDMALNDLLAKHDPMSRKASLAALCRNAGIEYVDFPQVSTDAFMSEAAHLAASLPDEFDDLLTVKEFHGILGDSLASWLASAVAGDSKPTPSRHVGLVVSAIAQFLAIRAIFAQLITECDEPAEVVVWNGRLPKYAAPWVAALDLGASVYFYENSGNRPTSYSFEDFPPFDRVLTQRAALAEYERVRGPETDLFVKSWLASRQEDSAVNPFLQSASPMNGNMPGTATPKTDQVSAPPLVVMFTTSPDELVAVPGDWSTGEWRDQSEAFAAAGEAMTRKGYRVLVRLHPNLANKSWREYCEQVRAYAGLPFTVVLATDFVDSYTLVRDAAAVFVWSSTIGVEAVAMGVPTYVLGAALYDEIADVRKLGSTAEIDALDDIQYEVDSESAYPATYWQLTELARHPLEKQSLALSRAMHLRNDRYRWMFKIAKTHRVVYLPKDLVQSPRPWMRIGYLTLGQQRTRRLMSFVTRRYLMGSDGRE